MQVTELLQSIKEYQQKLGYSYDYESVEEQMTHIRELTLALHIEVTEFINETPHKPWRAIADQEFNKEAAAYELIDCMFFVCNLWSAIGMPPSSFEHFFENKLEENLARISRGYNTETLKTS